MATVEKLIMQVMGTRRGVDITHLSTHDEGSVVHRLYVFTAAIARLFELLLAQQVDVIHLHVSERGSIVRSWLLVAIATLFGIPLVLHTHGSQFHTFYEQSPGWVQSLTRWSFQRASRVVVLSQSWADYYLERCQLRAGQVQVLYNPVDISHPVPNRAARKGPVNVVFAGRVGARKGTFDLLRAVSQLAPATRQQVRLWVAGDGETEHAQQLVAQLGLVDQVEILGWVGTADLATLLAKADIFALPSYNEGLPMAILEAMSWGLPVVTTPVGGIPEVVRSHRNGWLVEAGNIAALAAALEQLVTAPDQRLALGQAARQTVLPFDLSAYSDQLFVLYSTVVKSVQPAQRIYSTRQTVKSSILPVDVPTKRGTQVS